MLQNNEEISSTSSPSSKNINDSKPIESNQNHQNEVFSYNHIQSNINTDNLNTPKSNNNLKSSNETILQENQQPINRGINIPSTASSRYGRSYMR